MKNIIKFESFLNRIQDENNKILIDTIRKGFKAVVESYADLREEPVNVLDIFNQRAAATAAYLGNNVINFLNNSKEEHKHMFSVDENPELDNIRTSEFNQYVEPPKKYDEIQEDLGLTAGHF